MYISVRGEVTVEALQDALDIDKITLFSILKTLDKRGLVRRSSDAYRPA
ncbi:MULTISPECIES: MarR family transcriptional regulator [Halostella]|nr:MULTISPECIES: MarR family transcriptional regulator [Halostella]